MEERTEAEVHAQVQASVFLVKQEARPRADMVLGLEKRLEVCHEHHAECGRRL